MPDQSLIPAHPSRLIFIAALGLLAFPIGIWLSSIGNPSDYFIYDVPPGQRLYVVSKLAGLIAITLFWFQLILKLAIKTNLYELRGQRNISQHKILGIIILAVTILHVALFISAVSIRSKHFALNLLLPDFTHGFYNAAVAIGVLVFWGLLLAVAMGIYQSKLYRSWKLAHQTVIGLFVLSILHSWLLGSETALLANQLLYLTMLLSLMALGVIWKRSSNI